MGTADLSVVVWNATVHQPSTTLRTSECILWICDTVPTVPTDIQRWLRICLDICWHITQLVREVLTSGSHPIQDDTGDVPGMIAVANPFAVQVVGDPPRYTRSPRTVAHGDDCLSRRR